MAKGVLVTAVISVRSCRASRYFFRRCSSSTVSCVVLGFGAAMLQYKKMKFAVNGLLMGLILREIPGGKGEEGEGQHVAVQCQGRDVVSGISTEPRLRQGSQKGSQLDKIQTQTVQTRYRAHSLTGIHIFASITPRKIRLR